MHPGSRRVILLSVYHRVSKQESDEKGQCPPACVLFQDKSPGAGGPGLGHCGRGGGVEDAPPCSVSPHPLFRLSNNLHHTFGASRNVFSRDPWHDATEHHRQGPFYGSSRSLLRAIRELEQRQTRHRMRRQSHQHPGKPLGKPGVGKGGEQGEPSAGLRVSRPNRPWWNVDHFELNLQTQETLLLPSPLLTTQKNLN